MNLCEWPVFLPTAHRKTFQGDRQQGLKEADAVTRRTWPPGMADGRGSRHAEYY